MTTPPAAPLDDLENLLELSPEHAAARLEELLARDPSPSTDDDTASLLADPREGSPILARLSLASLDSLVDRTIRRLGDPTDRAARPTAWALLDALRRSVFLTRISAAEQSPDWTQRLLELVDGSGFTFPRLFAQRAAASGSRPLFRVPGAGRTRTVTWHQAAGRVDLIARSLIAASRDDGDARIAILSRNRLEMALVDLACLTSGIENVMIPATASEADVLYILDHARIATVIVGGRDELAVLLAVRDRAPGLRRVFVLEPDGARPGVEPLESLLGRAAEVSLEELAARRDRVRVDDVATVMYTSGTTGTPKGIVFSQRNIVFKRFARALALPEIGEDDVFVSYLPLFHTFGRFLEMTGCVFWGATYCFAENPSIEILARQMREQRATVLISIPMKWMQLYEFIRQEVDVEAADDAEVQRALRNVVGSGLRWGLSAAGYLDPEIFKFFQRHGVELMSGFGMTEATGGITMTPPGRYRDDSLGCALPGIEIDVADDGELKIRGPYVMIGHLDPPDGAPSFDADGWFHTGDLMERDGDGFIRIVDRKKEIYKNIQGQTIAPQKIENLFRDFESVARVFLVGDHRPYNTALIWPNPDFRELDLASLSPDRLKDHFRSLVVSANAFLAPYERIVDFAVVSREPELARGELTAKGTYRRKTLERSFADTIRLLYRRQQIKVGELEVVVPNWLFQALGVTAQDLVVDETALVLAPHGRRLELGRHDQETIRAGSVLYRHSGRSVDLGMMLSSPALWVGNEQLVGFAPLDPEQRDRRRRRRPDLEWLGRTRAAEPTPEERTHLTELRADQRPGLEELHLAALLLASDREEDALLGLEVLERTVMSEDQVLRDHALRVLRRAATATSRLTVQQAFRVLAIHSRGPGYRQMLSSFLDRLVEVLDGTTLSELVDHDFTPEQTAAFLAETEARCFDPEQRANVAAMLRFMVAYAATHPTAYRRLRTFATRMTLAASSPEMRRVARKTVHGLEHGFRQWLGRPSRIAVDPETGGEYRWRDVVVFADDVDDEARERILAALSTSPVLGEASFLFTGGAPINLDDILPGGVWVKLLGADHGKSVYRVAVKTRTRDQVDVAVNLARQLSDRKIREEIDWLILCGPDGEREPLVEDFGGYWPEQRLWTEEFIPGETLDRELRRLARRERETDRLRGLWPFAAWSALAAYVDFWQRTGRRLEVADPVPANVIVPGHDYHVGARLVSISSRRRFRSVSALLAAFKQRFVDPLEAEHTLLAGLAGWDVLFSALLEVVGEEEGLSLLRQALEADPDPLGPEAVTAARSFIAAVERRGFLSRRLFFACKRYRRWEALNPGAMPEARAQTLQEMFATYGLGALQTSSPESRVRFFRETVFRTARGALATGLEELIAQLRRRDLAPEELSASVSDLRAHLELSADEDYYLTRLSYPYLQPEDEAEFVPTEAGGVQQSEMVVTTTDREGREYRIRHALSAREIARLHRLFLAAKLEVHFRPEHRFLVAINDRGHLMGGLFYELEPENQTAHMDKVVVADRFQGAGIAGALLEELCNRLRTAGCRSLTTGFFRPEFFYRFGFSVERRYAGLVKELGPSGSTP